MNRLILSLAISFVLRLVRNPDYDNNVIIGLLERKFGFSRSTAITIVWYLGELIGGNAALSQVHPLSDAEGENKTSGAELAPSTADASTLFSAWELIPYTFGSQEPSADTEILGVPVTSLRTLLSRNEQRG